MTMEPTQAQPVTREPGQQRFRWAPATFRAAMYLLACFAAYMAGQAQSNTVCKGILVDKNETIALQKESLGIVRDNLDIVRADRDACRASLDRIHAAVVPPKGQGRP